MKSTGSGTLRPEQAIGRIRQALDSGRLTINALDDGSGVLLDVDGEQLMTLNATGMALVRGIDGGAEDVESLGRLLSDAFEVETQRAEADASAFVVEIAGAL